MHSADKSYLCDAEKNHAMQTLNLQSLADSHLDVRYNRHVAVFSGFNDMRNRNMPDILIDGFLFVVVTRGIAQLSVEEHIYQLQAGDIVTCKPRHIFERSMMSMDFDALILFISPEYVTQLSQVVRLEWTHAMYATTYQVLHADEPLLKRCHLYFDMLRNLLSCPATPNKEMSLCLLFASMAYDLRDLRQLNEEELLHQTYSSGENIMRRFMQRLHSPGEPFLKVHEYAALFHVTPKYFSSICKRLTGRTANQIIGEETIRLAQIYLRDSSKNIKQIAALLGFKNQSHFGRFFRLHIGMSPQQFRDGKTMQDTMPEET